MIGDWFANPDYALQNNVPLSININNIGMEREI